MARNFVPREDGQGNIGRSDKNWDKGYFKEIVVETITNDELAFAKQEAEKVIGKADKTYVDTVTQSIASGSPKGVYATLTALQTDFPTGTTGIYIVSADGKWYYWNGSLWTAGGVYQATILGDGSVTTKNLANASVSKDQLQGGNSGVNSFEWEFGTVTGGVNSASTTRIRTVNHISFEQDATFWLANNVDYRYAISLYDDNLTFISAEVNLTAPYVFNAPAIARIVTYKADNSDLIAVFDIVKNNVIMLYSPAVITEKIADKNVTSNKIADGAVRENELNPSLLEKQKMDFYNSKNLIANENLISFDGYFSGTLTPSLLKLKLKRDENGDYTSIDTNPSSTVIQIIRSVSPFNRLNLEISYDVCIDSVKNVGTLLGLSANSSGNSSTVMFGYEPAHQAIEAYVAGSFKFAQTGLANGWHACKIIFTEFGTCYFYLNDTLIGVDNFDPAVISFLRLNIKLGVTGVEAVGDWKIRNLIVKQSGGIGSIPGKNVHVYKFGGAGNDYCFVRTPDSYDPNRAKPYPLVICNHGNGWTMNGNVAYTNWTSKTQFGVDTQNNGAYLDTENPYYVQYSNETIERFLEAGYVVCGAENYNDGLYGNNDCRQACQDFFYHMLKTYNVEEKCYMIGASNGAMTTLNSVRMLGGVHRCKGIILQYPLTNLQYSFQVDHPDGVKAAYGITTSELSEFLTKTVTHDPMLVDTLTVDSVKQKTFPLPPVLIYYSTADTAVPSIGHAQQLIALLQNSNSCYIESVCVNPSGESYEHGDYHHFDPIAYLAFFEKFK